MSSRKGEFAVTAFKVSFSRSPTRNPNQRPAKLRADHVKAVRGLAHV
jgi:hypothetical protein